MTSTESEPQGRVLLPVLLFIAFADTFFQMPILSPFAASLGAGPALAGLVVGGYSLTNMLGNVAAGPILDRYGYLRPLAAAYAATGVVLLAYPLLTSPQELLGVRLLHGLTAATLVPAIFAWSAARAASGSEVASMGRLGALIGAAAVICPPASGILVSRAGFAAAYVGLGGLFLATGAVLFVRARQPLRTRREGRLDSPLHGVPAEGSRLFAAPLLEIVRTAPERGLLLIWFGALAMVSGIGTLALRLPLDLAAVNVQSPTRTAGVLMGLYSAAAVGAMLGLPRLHRRAGSSATLAVAGAGLAVMALGAVTLGAMGTVAGQALGVTVLGLGFGTAFPALNGAIAQRVEHGRRGSAFSIFYAFYSLGAVLGPVAAGMVGHLATAPGWGYTPAALASLVLAVLTVRRSHGERTGGRRR